MREVNGWTFLAYYGIIYLFFLILIVVAYGPAQEFAKPIAALIFPIAGGNSLMKNILVDTGMYWGMVLFYTFFIQKIRLKF